MKEQNHGISVANMILAILVLLNAIVLSAALTNSSSWYYVFAFTAILLIVAIGDTRQSRHAIVRNFPLIGHFRYLFESIRPEIRQYFFESDLDGKPFSRRQRSIVYQRSKGQKETVAFGMLANTNAPGYEWVNHSNYPVELSDMDLRVQIGSRQCAQPYKASIFNIGAMSYGALSKTAISALNRGASIGRFAHNTGEGGISQHHLQGGDLIWQIGTGYFGCRDESGNFHPLAFRKNALLTQVKMIELKLSQGAKPGLGGILPAVKNTPEIAAIRLVVPGTTVRSPAAHSAFSTPAGMLAFVQLLRELSDGKPVGIKLCLGDHQEFVDICRAIETTGILPDYICVDGGEGGTGAGTLEFTDHVGTPLFDALAFVKRTLDEFDLSEEIKIIAAGKVITGFDILKCLALGAAACYSARGMMLSLGCIQALVCDTGKCPVGVATQTPALYKGLDPADKSARVANFHAQTMRSVKSLMEACGFRESSRVDAVRFFRRINDQEVKSLAQIYFADKNNKSVYNMESQLN